MPIDASACRATGVASECSGIDSNDAGVTCVGGTFCFASRCVADGVCARECAGPADCPAGWNCIQGPDAGLMCACRGAGLEACNGVDDDCDGRVDEGASCDDARVCVGGTCVCPPERRCGAACADLANDAANCGGCGHACADGMYCDGGACAVPRVTGISIGNHHACLVLRGGQVRCLGDDASAALGDGTIGGAVRPRPRAVLGLCDATSVAIQTVAINDPGSASCALVADGTAVCWGQWFGRGPRDTNCGYRNRFGWQYQPCSRAPAPACDLADAQLIALGSAHGCALLRDGTARCWGLNLYQQLGDGSATQQSVAPVQVVGVRDASQLAAGENHTCALRSDRHVTCWGENNWGQLGSGSFGTGSYPPPPATPVDVVGLGDAVQLAIGGRFTCALRAGGTVVCWGPNTDGALGNGSVGAGYGSSPIELGAQATPGEVVGLSDVAEIAAGARHVCARLRDGTVQCWGNQYAEGPMTVPVATPRAISGLAGVQRIWAGGSATCALDADGAVWCWGGGNPAQYDAPVTASRAMPVRLRW